MANRFFGIFALSALTVISSSCIKSQTSSTTSTPQSAVVSACVGLQGNGLRFASHVGTYTALLENNIKPVVSLGGSSGSIVGSVVMGLMQNQSVKRTPVTFQGRNLSEAQRASLVLAAIPDVIDTFIFLPAFDTLDIRNWQVVPSILRFIAQSQFGKVLAGDDGARLLSIEATVGQAVLLTDFTMNADFTSVMQSGSYSDRRKKMFELWQQWSEGISTSMRELVDAAALPESQWNANPQMAVIGDRFYRMFQQDMKQENSEQNVERWRQLLRGVNFFIKHPKLTSVTGVGKVEDILAAKFFLPNPELLWNAYLGFGKKGQFIELPQGMIVHSTLRRGMFSRDRDGSIRASEGVGLENLYQGYVVANHSNSKLVDELISLRTKQSEVGGGFLPFFADGESNPANVKYAYAPTRVAVLRNTAQARGKAIGNIKDDSQTDVMFKEGRRGVAHAVAFSAGEPGPFRRLPVFIGPEDVADNTLKLPSGQSVYILSNISDPDRLGDQDGLISFGGWSENVPISTLAMLPSCSQASVFVSSGKKGPGNDFQLQAMRASVRGWNFLATAAENIAAALGRSKPESERLVLSQFDALNRNVDFSRNITSRNLSYNASSGRWEKLASSGPTYFQQDIDFDAPSELNADKKIASVVNGKIVNSRFALMMASYQKASENMATAGNQLRTVRALRINAFGNSSSSHASIDPSTRDAALYLKKSVEEIDAELAKLR
ncbi:MAG: hypothetical protein RLZZ488_2371 [Pseudomonadota bacterium]|jgi:hypothetical protein